MTTIFTRIIRGELPGTFVYRDEDVVAFMTINPIACGHTLVVPIAEVDQWTDLPSQIRGRLFEVSHAIGEAQKKAFACNRVALIIAGFEVPHCHVHVIPANDMGDVSFANAASHVDPSELQLSADAIRANLKI